MDNRNCWVKRLREAAQSHLNGVIENIPSGSFTEGSADTLYHYTSIENAAKILSSSTILHGSSARLNDPWDCKINVQMAFEYESLLDEVEKILEGILKGEKTLNESLWIESCGHPYAPIQRRIANWMGGNGDGIEVERLPGGQVCIRCIDNSRRSTIIEECIAEMRKMKGCWIENKDRARTFIYANIQANVFCMSEEVGHMLMWSHYANSHRGVAIGFCRRDDAENLLRRAHPVKYSSELPELHASGEAYRIASSYPLLPDETVRECLFRKSPNWEYEKEWRLFLPPGENNRSITVFGQDDIESISLGCRCSYDDVCQIIDIADRHWPNVDIYLMKTSDKEYGLNKEKMRCGNSPQSGSVAKDKEKVNANIARLEDVFASSTFDDSIVDRACLYVEESISKIDDNYRLVNEFRRCVRRAMMERSKMPAGSGLDPNSSNAFFQPVKALIARR